jgi:hypothetical protein
MTQITSAKHSAWRQPATWRLNGERPARGAEVPEIGEHTASRPGDLPPDYVEVPISKGVLFVPAPPPAP